MNSVIDWLLEEDQPAIVYQTLTGLLARDMDDERVRIAFRNIERRGWARDILKDQLPGFRVGNTQEYQGYWHNYALLNRPKYIATVWKFLVLADLGLSAENKRVFHTCRLLSERYLKNEEAYHLCMTANIARALLQMSFNEKQERISKALHWLTRVQKEDGGWHCFESKSGTLDCWEPLSAFAALPKNRQNRSIKRSMERGAEFYLEKRLYSEGSKKYLPWFRFHYPNHYYYDILVGLVVLSTLGYGKDPRIRFALEHLQKKRRDGRWNLDALNPDIANDLPGSSYSSSPPFEPFPAVPYGLESVGRPSKIITLRALKVLKEVEAA